LEVPINAKTLVFSSIGMVTQEIKMGPKDSLFVKMKAEESKLEELVVTGYAAQKKRDLTGSNYQIELNKDKYSVAPSAPEALQGRVSGVQISKSRVSKGYVSKESNYDDIETNEEYAKLNENTFHDVKKEALSTFSIDVDRAGYSNVRRMLGDGIMPPKDAVRIEEMINYFDYQYPQPTGNEPVSINTEYTDSPWNSGLKLLKVGIQAKTIPTDNLPASNLVFLIDVSGSMQDQNKLPLVKKGFGLLVDQLRPQDKVAIVVYAGAAGMVLSPTSGQEKTKIKDALNNLSAGGSTAGGEGIKLAYKLANENFVKGAITA
jgi:Ca-activated chloride channel homolog